jgi:adenylate cyclase
MAQIEFQNDLVIDEPNLNQTLLEISIKNHIPHMHVCGGTARCSTCRVMVVEGLENCQPRNNYEQALADRKGFEPNIRLACQTRVTGPVTVRRLVLDDDDADLAIQAPQATTGREARLAIMFTDVRDFTNFSEAHLSYDVIHILNRYFYQIGECVLRNEGYIDKYIGDGMMALFGCTCTDPVINCYNAVSAGLEMLEELKGINKYLKRNFDIEFRMGIGIHFGEAILGELGHPNRRSVTAIGDSVNMAARIETATKQHQVSLLVSEAVRHELRNRLQIGRVFDASLKGKSGSYSLYEVARLHEQTQIIDREQELRDQLNRALNEIVTQQKAPLFLRAAFHDAGKYNGRTKTGGADGTLRLPEHLARVENRGMDVPINLLKPIKEKFRDVSWADLIALSGAVAVQRTGGPEILIPLGRTDSEQYIPASVAELEAMDAAALKARFAEMGLNTQEMVVLSGAHTIGRANGVPFTDDWFKFNNSFFKALLAGDTGNMLKTDKVLLDDPECRGHIERYAEDQDAFFKDFANAYRKMTLLGTGLTDTAAAKG